MLIVGIPFGLVCLIVGVSQFFKIPSSINELVINTGYITNIGEKTIYDEKADSLFEVVFIETDNKNEYYSLLKKHKSQIRNEWKDQIIVNNRVTIWHKEQRNYIEQLAIENEILIEYSPPYWIAHFFFWLGLITLITAIGYVI